MQSASYAANQQIAEMVAADVLKTYQDEYPSAMASFQDDWEACIAYMRCPTINHKRIRTTNLLERSFTEKSCLKLQHPVTSQRPVAGSAGMSALEPQQIALLRKELGLVDVSETSLWSNHAVILKLRLDPG